MSGTDDPHSLFDILHYNADKDLGIFLHCADRDFGLREAGLPYKLLEDMKITKQGEQQLFVDARREMLEIRVGAYEQRRGNRVSATAVGIGAATFGTVLHYAICPSPCEGLLATQLLAATVFGGVSYRLDTSVVRDTRYDEAIIKRAYTCGIAHLRAPRKKRHLYEGIRD